MNKKCKIVDCPHLSASRGWCAKHYYRWRTHGDPSISLVPRHGHKWPIESSEHIAWSNMIQRATNPNNTKDWERYGGRGISIDPAWRQSFIAFYEHVGPKPPDTSLERMNNSRGYVPGNVKWATKEEQANNTRINVFYTIGNETLSLAQWVRRCASVSYGTVYSRVLLGWDIERALNTPRIHKSGRSRDRKVSCL